MDFQWKILLPTMAFGSIPQIFLFTYFVIIFCGFPIPHLTRKLWSLAISSSFLTVSIMFLIPAAFRPFYTIGVIIALVTFIMRGIRIRDRMLLGIFLVLCSLVNETLVSYLASLAGVPLEATAQDPRSTVAFACILPAAAGILAFVMNKRDIHPGKTVLAFLGREGNKYLKWLLLLFVTNLLLSCLVYILLAGDRLLIAAIAMILMMTIGLIIFIITVHAMARTREAAILTTQELYIDDINNMFTAIRGQRHDFLNHVQVIRSLLQLKKHQELDQYVKELVGEITEINELLQIGNPALAALIQSKMISALNRRIEFRYSFTGLEQLKDGIASIDFVKIAGNLIDNAFDEVLKRPPDNRWVEVKGWLDESSFNMSVRNPSRKLSEEEMNLLFVPGYSTKDNMQHSGLGLSIVKERVDYYKGAVKVKNGEMHGTTFVVKIPLQT